MCASLLKKIKRRIGVYVCGEVMAESRVCFEAGGVVRDNTYGIGAGLRVRRCPMDTVQGYV